MGQKNLEFLGFGLKISREGCRSQITYLHRYDVLRYTDGGIIIALFSVRKGPAFNPERDRAAVALEQPQLEEERIGSTS
jgi:hypothetical protein